MDVPAAVESAVGDEAVVARVSLAGDDALFVTPTRTVVYRAEGLLSNESVESFDHDAERLAVSEGRRKATFTLDYGLDGDASFGVPVGRTDDVLLPVLAGVLNANGVTDPGETVSRVYRFGELTLVVASERLVRHVGAAVWETDHEEIRYADVTDVGAEEGSVASQLVLETTGRTQRIKVPNASFRDVRETVESALFAHHDVPNAAAFRREVAPETDDDARDAASAFDDAGVDPIETSPTAGDVPSEGGRNANGSATPRAGGRDAAAPPTSDSDAATALTGNQDRRSAADAAPESRRVNETARSETAADMDLDAVAAELEAVRASLDEQRQRAEAQRDAIEDQRTAIHAQLDALDAQRERVDAALDALDDR